MPFRGSLEKKINVPHLFYSFFILYKKRTKEVKDIPPIFNNN